MAKKRKLNKLNHIFVIEWLGKDWYRDDQGRITDSEGIYAGDKLNRIINESYPQVAPDVPGKKSKETLEKAFPKTYEEPREKQRSAGRQKDQTDKEAQEYKRDTQELRTNINAISGLMRENSALIRQQLSAQQRSITLLSEIANNIKSGGGSGGKGGGIGGLLGSLALGVGGLAVGGIAGYLMGGSGNNDDEEDEDPKKQPPQPQPPQQQSSAIKEAQTRGDDKEDKDYLNIDAKEILYNSDLLTFTVGELTIDAEKIVNDSKQSASGTASSSSSSSSSTSSTSSSGGNSSTGGAPAGAAGAAGAPGGAPGGGPPAAPGGGGNSGTTAAADVAPVSKPPVAGPNAPLKDVKDQNGDVIAQVPDTGAGKLVPRKTLMDTLFGQSDEEKKAMLAKTQEIEKNGPASTAMGDLGTPGMSQFKTDAPAATPAKQKTAPATRTVMVDDPKWDRHSQSRAMFEEATARENRGENSQSIYWAAEAQRKKELTASPPQIKKTVASAAKVDQAPAGSIGASSNPYGSGDPLAQVSAEREDPETLSQSGRKEDSSQRELAGDQVGARLRGDASRQRAEEERKRQGAVRMQGIDDEDSARRPGEIGELGKIQTQDKAMDAGASLVQSGARLTGRNLAKSLKGVEYGQEAAAPGAFAEPSGDSLYPEGPKNQGNSESSNPVNKDQPLAPSSTHKAFDYLFEKGKKIFNLDFGS